MSNADRPITVSQKRQEYAAELQAATEHYLSKSVPSRKLLDFIAPDSTLAEECEPMQRNNSG